MKFQKTLLAATLAIVGFGAQANVLAAQESVAQEAVNAIGTANLAKYRINGTDYVFVESVKEGTPYLVAGQFYTVGENDQLIKAAAQVIPEGLEAISKGQVTFEYNQGAVQVTPGSTTTEQGAGGNVDQNNYWYSGTTTTNKSDTTKTEGDELTLIGKLVNPGENGNTADYEDQPFGKLIIPGTDPVGGETTITTVRKDIQIGNLTEQPKGTTTDGLTQYQFQLEKNQAQGTLATIQTEVNGNTAVAGVTGNGLAVLDVPKGGLVDLEKGTVTFTTTTGGEVVRTALDTGIYKTDTGSNVLRIDGKYFVVDGNSLQAYTGDTSQFVKADGTAVFEDGKGLSEEKSGSKTETSVNTGLVSNKNVTYGESVTTVESASSIQISVTNPEFADELSGKNFGLGETSVKTTSKDVVTGIIAVDKETGEKTYGVQATTVVDNEVTGQTTVTAEGITTTGTINASDYLVNGESITSSIDAKVAEAKADLDGKLVEFNKSAGQLNLRVDQLNSRINDVEQTAYRGVAIALAAQQNVPNIKPGQFAVFGGVGHYESESAFAMGVVGAINDRTSVSGALGVAGGSEIGGRVGVAYVFGGK